MGSLWIMTSFLGGSIAVPNQPNPSNLRRVTPRLQVQAFDPETWKVIGAGVFLAVLISLLGQVSFFLSYFVILIHELGHSAISWLFGFPAIPAFDFLHGGGVSIWATERWFILVWLVYVGLGWLLYRYRHNSLTARCLWGVGLVYSLCAFTPLHSLLRTSMGHGFELIFAGIFGYRGLSGYACRYPIERPLYLMLGVFTILVELKFCGGLLWNPEFLEIYLQGKGGIIDNDLVLVARDYLHVNLSLVVVLLLMLALATPVMTMGLYRYRQWLGYSLYRLFGVLHAP
jgi:hypothetical protein